MISKWIAKFRASEGDSLAPDDDWLRIPVRYLHIPRGAPIPTLQPDQPYRAVAIIQRTLSDQERDKIAAWLVASGCLYLMAWGRGCEAFHDSVDWAQIDKYPDGTPDDAHIMTTTHEAEPLEEVLWYAQFCASHPTLRFGETLLIHLAERPREAQILERFAAARDSVE